MNEPTKLIVIDSPMLGIPCHDTTEEDAAMSVDDETDNLVQACEKSGINVDGKPDDPQGDRYVFRLSDRNGDLFVVWILRSELIRRRARHFRK